MKKKLLYLLVYLFWPQSILAADLVQVYCRALKCDPTFNAAMADLMANRENIPINRALLLPRLDIHADTERQRIRYEGLSFSKVKSSNLAVGATGQKAFNNNSFNYCLKLSQPIFNYSNWARLQQAKASVRQAEASFCAAAQDLIVRVSRAYFDVLIADTNLYYTREYKKAAAEQLRQTKAQFKAGAVAIANVYELQAGYDAVVAQEVTDRFALVRSIEALRTITNQNYCDLEGLNAYLPLVTPNPCGINNWVCASEKQNYQLLSAQNAAMAARDNIKVQAGGDMPAINTFGEYQYNFNSETTDGFMQRQKTIEAGLELDWAPVQGGGVLASTRQACYLYREACQNLEFTHRQVVANTRNAYLGIFAGMAKIRADHAAVLANEQSMKATIDGFKAGTRTSLDVLNTQTQFFSSQKIYTVDRYEYIFQTFLLKQAAGTLSVCDLQHVNAWLYRHVTMANAYDLLEGDACATSH